jgi:hypothetical protein
MRQCRLCGWSRSTRSPPPEAVRVVGMLELGYETTPTPPRFTGHSCRAERGGEVFIFLFCLPGVPNINLGRRHIPGQAIAKTSTTPRQTCAVPAGPSAFTYPTPSMRSVQHVRTPRQACAVPAGPSACTYPTPSMRSARGPSACTIQYNTYLVLERHTVGMPRMERMCLAGIHLLRSQCRAALHHQHASRAALL